MSHSLDQIDWCDVPLVPPALDPDWEAEAARRVGGCTYVAQFVSPVRWMLEADELMHSRVTPNLSLELQVMISLVVAMDNSCRHCYGAFRSMLKILGYPEKEVRRVEETLTLDQLEPREQLALDFARRVSRSDPRPGVADVRALAEAGFQRIEIAELAYLAADIAVGTRVATLLALPPDPVEQMEADWRQRVIRRFTRPQIRKAFSKVWQADGDPDYAGPCADIVDELRGSPAANALAKVLTGMWASEITSPRLKSIIFAVIARGLECSACETEAIRPLIDEGWSEADIEHLLTHLNSDRLDTFETKVLHFARDTIRYRTRRLQDTAREFAEGIDRELLIEVIGLVSNFNGLARMSILLDPRSASE